MCFVRFCVQQRHHGVDAVMDCAASLVWSQEKCLCIFDPTIPDRPIEQKGNHPVYPNETRE